MKLEHLIVLPGMWVGRVVTKSDRWVTSEYSGYLLGNQKSANISVACFVIVLKNMYRTMETTFKMLKSYKWQLVCENYCQLRPVNSSQELYYCLRRTSSVACIKKSVLFCSCSRSLIMDTLLRLRNDNLDS